MRTALSVVTNTICSVSMLLRHPFILVYIIMVRLLQ